MSLPKIESLNALIEELQKLPGIGARSAERLAFHILRGPREAAEALAAAIIHLKDNIRHCSNCFQLTENDPCAMCSDPRRDHQRIWVVEQPKDVLALEATGLVNGLYHVLMGHISPLDGVGPGDLTIDQLMTRVRNQPVEEIILATNPNMEGDGTALHIMTLLEPHKIKVSRLARGLAVGSQLEYATPAMLDAAIRHRR